MYVFTNKETFDNLWNETEYQKYYEEYMQNYENVQSTIVIPAPLMYMAIFFDILSLVIEDKNKINEKRMKTLHPFKELVYIIS